MYGIGYVVLRKLDVTTLNSMIELIVKMIRPINERIGL
jgi:hypothetical protein